MQRVGFVLFDGFHVITFAAMAVFEVANKTLDEPRYDLRLLSEMGGLIRSSVGALVQTEPFGVERFDTLIVAGAGETFEPSLGMLDFVRKAPEVARRVASSCIGAFTLAEAGILDGRRATTHWQHASRLQKRFSQGQRRGGSHLHRRPRRLDFGWNDRLHRPDAGSGGKRRRNRSIARGRQEARPSSSSRRGAIAVFGLARNGAEVGSHPDRARVRETKSQQAPRRRGPCEGREPQHASVHASVHGRNRSIPRKGDREASRRSRKAPDRARASPDRTDRAGDGFCRPRADETGVSACVWPTSARHAPQLPCRSGASVDGFPRL
jgi:putative intracellular protease/amidase